MRAPPPVHEYLCLVTAKRCLEALRRLLDLPTADRDVSTGFRAARSALPSEQIQSVAGRLDGRLAQVQQDGFQYEDTLQNYLRRGSNLIFAPSAPA